MKNKTRKKYQRKFNSFIREANKLLPVDYKIVPVKIHQQTYHNGSMELFIRYGIINKITGEIVQFFPTIDSKDSPDDMKKYILNEIYFTILEKKNDRKYND